MTKGGACEIRVRGRVQGVGFRPAVWRLAQALSLDGDVLNDGEGVLVRVANGRELAGALIEALKRDPPPLADIESFETRDSTAILRPGFFIAESVCGVVATQVSPDARLCVACQSEILDSRQRRFDYAFTNCTHCGPRLTILDAIPYDRASTSMAAFPMCPDCRMEYENPADRRFHAEPIACPTCGPGLTLRTLPDGGLKDRDPLQHATALLAQGAIIAVKGLGGYQFACDATNDVAVARLRQGKRRDGKPFAVMMRDLQMVRRYCRLGSAEARLLESPAAPIVLLSAFPSIKIAAGIAPGLNNLGVMLPTTPLHMLLLARLDVPLVMTSGNLAGEPQITDDDEAVDKLGAAASHMLSHNRRIANRVDDSVARVMAGKTRLIRRARGYAPAPIPLPAGFESAPDMLALGGELKSTFCLLRSGQAILSQHQGDLEQAPAFKDFRKNLALYGRLFDHAPTAVAVDIHPDYLSSKLGRTLGLPVFEVQHHHAHIASCMAENGWTLRDGKVLGIALDGLGWGTDRAIWGGEFLLADYGEFERLAWFKPVAMPGGVQAIREPWRNLYAHLDAALGWRNVQQEFPQLACVQLLNSKPLAAIAGMMARGLNTPPASSCGRLFDAVAAALQLCDSAQSYEGDAASRLEAMAENSASARPYPFRTGKILDPAPMWYALLADLAKGTDRETVAACFHAGLAQALVQQASLLTSQHDCMTVVLSGGCFQNRLLFEQTLRGLEHADFAVLTHSKAPANDGGLALGQAAIAAARHLNGIAPCV